MMKTNVSPLLGCWVSTAGKSASPDRLALQFTPRGNLVHTEWKHGREVVRFLRYQTESSKLVTSDPANGIEDRFDFVVTREGVLKVSNGESNREYVRGESFRSFRATDKLVDLIVFAVTIGFDRIQNLKTLHPFVMSDVEGDTSFLSFEGAGKDRAEAVALARHRSSEVRERSGKSVLVFDGTLAQEKARHDAIFVEARDAHAEHGIVVAQRYRRRGLFRRPRLQGSLVYCGRAENPNQVDLAR